MPPLMPGPWPQRRARLVVLVAALMGATLTARLGFWQLDRADQKIALKARIDGRMRLPPLAASSLSPDPAWADAHHFQRVEVQGRWQGEHTVYLDNRQLNGHPGFLVVTPLLLPGGDAVLVQRGWMPRNFIDRAALQPVPTPATGLQLAGRIAPKPAKLFELGRPESGAIRQNLDLTSFSRDIGVRLLPMSIQQLDAAQPLPGDAGVDAAPAVFAPDGLLRQWPAVALDVGKHHGYALQWFALCALITGLYVWFQILRPRSA